MVKLRPWKSEIARMQNNTYFMKDACLSHISQAGMELSSMRNPINIMLRMIGMTASWDAASGEDKVTVKAMVIASAVA